MNQIAVRLPLVVACNYLVHNLLLSFAELYPLLLCTGILGSQFHGVSQALGTDDSKSPCLLQTSYGLHGHAKLGGHPLAGQCLLLKQFLQQSFLCDLFLPLTLAQKGQNLLPVHQALQGAMLQLLHRLSGRNDRFQRLDHGGAVVPFHPGCQNDQLLLDPHAAFYHSQDLLGPGGVKTAYLLNLDHISLYLPVAVAEGHHHTRSHFQCVPKLFRYTILK